MIYVVCVDLERGFYMAWRNLGERGWGYSVNDAVVHLLLKVGEIKIEEVVKDA